MIVAGFDGTEAARAALAEAARLAAELGVGLHVVFSSFTSRSGGELGDLDAAVAERAGEVLAEAERLAAGSGAAITTEFRREEVAEGLVAAAQERDARYVVVGSNGERPLVAGIIGSTPTRLMRICARPVLVVRAPG